MGNVSEGVKNGIIITGMIVFIILFIVGLAYQSSNEQKEFYCNSYCQAAKVCGEKGLKDVKFDKFNSNITEINCN